MNGGNMIVGIVERNGYVKMLTRRKDAVMIMSLNIHRFLNARHS